MSDYGPMADYTRPMDNIQTDCECDANDEQWYSWWCTICGTGDDHNEYGNNIEDYQFHNRVHHGGRHRREGG